MCCGLCRLDGQRRTKNSMGNGGDADNKFSLYSWNKPEMFSKGIDELEIIGYADTPQTTAFLRWTRILRRVLET